MATTPKTVKTYALDGTKKDFTIPFEYLARKFVVVTLIGATRKELILITDYRFTTSTQITTNKAWGPADGYELIEIRRLTSAIERLVDFADGSILRAYDLNISQVQSLHIAEEARDLTADTIGVNNDGNLDARARRIVNLADAISPGDAVSLRQMQTWSASALSSANAAKTSETNALSSKNSAAASAAAALASQNAAKTSETNSKTSETNSKTSETAAKASQTAAAASQSAAQNWASFMSGPVSNGVYSSQWYATQASSSASTATAQADRAKTAADKLGDANQFVGTLNAIDDTTKLIQWKDGYSFDITAAQVGPYGSPRLRVDQAGIQKTGNIDITSTTVVTSKAPRVQHIATTGMLDALMQGPSGSQAFRVVSAYPIPHMRTPAKVNMVLACPGSGYAELQAYTTAGDTYATFTFNSNGIFAAPEQVRSKVLIADGMVQSRARAVTIASTSDWVALTATGAPVSPTILTHNLGVRPIGFHLEYKCITADQGWEVGDIISPVDINYQSGSTAYRGGFLENFDVNTAKHWCGGAGIVLIHKTAGATAPMTMARWQVRVTAIGLSNA